MTKCTTFYAIEGTVPQMSFVGEPTQEQNQRRVIAVEVDATMHQMHEHLRVEMRRSQAVQQKGANLGGISSPNI